MSKLSKLIKELCPEGVEYRPLGEIGSFERGRRFVKADAVESDGIPCVHYGELYTHYGLWANVHKSQIRSDIQTKLRYAEKNDVIIVGAGENNIDIGIAVAWLGDYKVAVHDACYIFKHQQDPKYISYLLRTNSYHQQIKKFVSEGKICSISAENLAKAVLPFPPVPIQQEIVRILDRYTELEEQLESELKAELEARKLQYEYYRNQLLNFAPPRSENVKWIKMKNICSLQRGKVYSKKYISENSGMYPVYSSQTANDGVLGNINTYDYDGSFLTWTTDGAHAGTIFYRKGKFSITNVCGLIIVSQDKLDLRFLYYWLSLTAKSYVNQGMGNPKLMSNQVENIDIPMLPLDEQKHIASTLDRLETLTSDLLCSLPSEIKARRQQYEYYREKLLTFKRKAA